MTQAKPKKFIDVATVHERLDNRAALESQIHADPADPVVGEQLQQAYRDAGRDKELLELLLTRAESVPSDRQRVGLLQQAAHLCAEQGDPGDALLVLLTAFGLDGENVEIADQMDQLAYITGQWDPVLDAYLLAAAKSENKNVAGGLWLRIACAHALVTGDSEALFSALDNVHSLDSEWAAAYLDSVEGQAHALELVLTLAQLYSRIEDRSRRARALSRAIAMTMDLPQKADLHAQLAELHVANSDNVAANWHLREALRLDPGRHDCQAALIALSKEAGDFRTAASMLRNQALAGATVRTEAAFEAAKLYSELDENTACFDLLMVTMNQDPHHLGAAVPLAERHYKDKRWAELEPLLELIIQNRAELSGPHKDALSEVELFRRAGECAAALEKWQQSDQYFAKVLALDPSDKKALAGSALARQKEGHLDGAFQAYQALFEQQQNSAASLRAKTLLEMATIRWQQGNDESLALAQQAAEIDPENADIGRLLAEIHESKGDFGAALKARQALLEHVDLATRIELHCEIANLRCRKLDDPQGAIAEYNLALEKDKDNRRVLHALMELYSACEFWEEAVETILRVAELESEPLRRGKYFDAAGDIARRRLGQDRAIDCFEQALRCFFVDAKELPENLRAGCMRPFHRMVEFLHDKQDYEQLERCYRRMIQRLPQDDPQVVQLWQEVGNLYSNKLGRTEDAIASYEVVSSLDDSTIHKRQLLGLYEQSDEQIDKAIEQRLLLTEKEPTNHENYDVLTELYLRGGQPDRAWCATRALIYLGHASEAQKSFFFQNQPAEMRWPRIPLDPIMWGNLRHPDENPHVRSVLALISDIMVQGWAVNEHDLIARDGHSHLHNDLRGLIWGVAYALGMPEARVTVDLELNADILFVPTPSGPAFVVGRGIWQAPHIRARVHSAAITIANARLDAQLRHLASLEQLDAIMMAAITLVRPDVAVAPEMADEVSHAHRALKKGLPQARKVRLAHAVDALINSGQRHDMPAWVQAVDCTAHRVALLLSGDLHVAGEIAARCPNPTEIMTDLVVFSCSKVHGDLRRDLSIEACVPT
jgi:tetratricopeptide (TPR) repeat protein